MRHEEAFKKKEKEYSINNNNNNLSTDSSSQRNEYRLPSVTISQIQLNHRRQLPLLPNSNVHLNNNNSNFIHREPPPPYYQSQQSATVHSETRRKIISPQRPAPIVATAARSQANVRSRVEEYRNRLSVSDSDSDEQQSRSRNRNHSRIKNEVLLDEDLFCPDLVRNCKSLPVVDDDDQDYIEIDELTSHLSLHNEVGLPNIKEPQLNHTAKMGQNVSLKRPKISLTWVLREQAQPPNSIKTFNWNVKPSEKTLFKKNSKSHEKLFSEKLYSENNLNDFRKAKKLNDDKKPNEPCKSEKIKKFRDNCCRQRDSSDNYDRLSDGIKVKSLSQVNLNVKSGSTENAPIYVTSAQSDSGVNRRYRRRRKRSQKFGYNINNINEFLSSCSLNRPANIPVVLSNASILYQTRAGQNQIETPLPLGMILNSIFKIQNWLYVQTPHQEEGYVNFHACLPLGIIQKSQTNSTKCWETSTDIFPNPSGNLTDSEKETQNYGGTRSEGRRTPKMRRNPSRTCSEKYLDSLYLLASQPKIIDHSYAQLKKTNNCKVTNFNNFDKLNGDYIQLKHNQEKVNLNANLKRQMLTTLLITDDFYSSEMMSVKKGDVVKLLACKEYEDKFWYFIKNRDNCEFYIPSSIATEFL
ncbi:hypothetical protein PVAND_007466 [Polypedilum vanderplanki]|uniref:SH3 domain-containing protein n=1 Tax=Polypedilum vanderplanki TaxID=319348 RepID=A0A9J6C702_POLVA|nr:hypothetical protein PVAND_007466 [Polypedilum vanderplanki]